MGEKVFLQFLQPEGFGKGREGHREKRERVNEADGGGFILIGQLKNFTAVMDLLLLAFLTMEFFNDRIAVIATKVVGDDC